MDDDAASDGDGDGVVYTVVIKRRGTSFYYSPSPDDSSTAAQGTTDSTVRGRREQAAAYALACISKEDSLCGSPDAVPPADHTAGFEEAKTDKAEEPHADSGSEAEEDVAASTEECPGSFRVNLIDSPGHFDFNAEVSAALRITDGAVVVVCAVEGVCAQTETVVRQAMAEYVRPVLVVNKVDRVLREQALSPEQCFDAVSVIVDKFNALVDAYQPPREQVGNWQVRYSRCCRLLAVGCWLLAVGSWLLAAGSWQLAVGS